LIHRKDRAWLCVCASVFVQVGVDDLFEALIGDDDDGADRSVCDGRETVPTAEPLFDRTLLIGVPI
jgi:hypothetical protein